MESKPIVVGPNKEQRKKGNKLTSDGRGLQLIGFVGILIGIGALFNLRLNASFFHILALSAISGTVGLILYGIGFSKVEEGKKLLEIKFTGYLDSMSPFNFEILVDDLYTKMGYECTNLKSSRDLGADIIALKEGIKYVIQTKHYNINPKVGSQIIRNVYGAIKMYDADKGIIVTTSYFTSPAIDSASKLGIELIDRDMLKQLVIKHYYKSE